jgi:two-component system, OmpR family, phosphate regulon sensor histidine kinase PhoR
MRVGHALRAVAGVTAVLIFLTGSLSATFFLTSLVYHNSGQPPSAFLAQLINSLLGLSFSFLILASLSYLFRSKQWTRQAGVFGQIIEAMEKIGKGNFNVRLDNQFRNGHESGLFGELANSVNNLAVELSQMERMRQEFISNASHELQSPLTSIRGFAQALQNDQLSSEERHHYLGIIETERTRLSRITDNLLKLASLESEHAKFEPRPYRLDKQLRSLILACEPQWRSKGIDMDVSLEETAVTADEDLLSQVWINLIQNSIRFTPDGGRVCVELRQQAGRVEFRITDTGAGISEEDQVHVFERFYKADKSRTRSHGGSGLGLAIAKKIVEMHQGTIGVASQPGAGATFTVRLPEK